MGRALRAADPLYLCGVFVATLLVTYVARAWRWGFLLAPARPGPVRCGLFSATVIGFMSGLLIPRAGEVVRPYPGGAEASGLRRPRASRRSCSSGCSTSSRSCCCSPSISTCCPRRAAQTHGPLLGVLKVAGAAAGAGALAILGVLLAWHRHAEPAMRLADRAAAAVPGAVRRRGVARRPLVRRGARRAPGLAVAPRRHPRPVLRGLAAARPRHLLEQPRLRAATCRSTPRS